MKVKSRRPGAVRVVAAKAMVTTGLAKVGYQYVNSDDCWMLAQRDAAGNQVPNPEKFPDGFQVPLPPNIYNIRMTGGRYP